MNHNYNYNTTRMYQPSYELLLIEKISSFHTLALEASGRLPRTQTSVYQSLRQREPSINDD